jgi:predicted patatin/cPLA2 family phospholipase
LIFASEFESIRTDDFWDKMTYWLAWRLIGVYLLLIGYYKTVYSQKQRVMSVESLTQLATLRELPRSVGTVLGDGSPRRDHPVLQAIIDRFNSDSVPGNRAKDDVYKIGLSIEGGGMRGAVSAGATAALHYLGLAGTFDCVYGSSAGSMIGAYFVSRQYGGISVYHDILPSAGRKFIDKSKLLSIGVPSRYKWFPLKNDVFNLDFLLYKVMSITQKFDYDTFYHNNKIQPLSIITSLCHPLKSLSLTSKNNNFYDKNSLLLCIRSSMLVPGVTGPLMELKKKDKDAYGSYDTTPYLKPYKNGIMRSNMLRKRKSMKNTMKMKNDQNISSLKYNHENRNSINHMNPMIEMDRDKNKDKDKDKDNDVVTNTISNKKSRSSSSSSSGNETGEEYVLGDALITEPIPYRSAVYDGCTHVLVLRTRPDPCEVILTGKGSVYGRLIARRCLENYNQEQCADFMATQGHVYIYAEDVLTLAAGQQETLFDKNVSHVTTAVDDSSNSDEKCIPLSRGVPVPPPVDYTLPPKPESEWTRAHLLSIAPTEGSTEVNQLEVGREPILIGMRDGARQVLRMFGPSLGLDDNLIDSEILLDDILPHPYQTHMNQTTTVGEYLSTEVNQRGIIW